MASTRATSSVFAWSLINWYDFLRVLTFARHTSQFDVGYNQITGDVPTQIGRMTKIVAADSYYGFLYGNSHGGASVPTELGALTGMTTGGGYYSFLSYARCVVNPKSGSEMKEERKILRYDPTS